MRRLLLVPFVLYLVAALPMRWAADDFCDLARLSDGILPAVRRFYDGWSGRYTYALAIEAGKLGGIGLAALPALAALLIGWYALVRLIGVDDATLVTVVALAGSPALPQSLYWQSGLFNYGLPLALVSVLVWWIRR